MTTREHVSTEIGNAQSATIHAHMALVACIGTRVERDTEYRNHTRTYYTGRINKLLDRCGFGMMFAMWAVVTVVLCAIVF